MNFSTSKTRNYGHVSSDAGIKAGIYLVAFIAVTLANLGLGQIPQADKAVAAATASGMAHVRVTGEHRFLVGFQGCGKGDVAKFDITATNPAGVKVSAYACSGVLKGTTIRF